MSPAVTARHQPARITFFPKILFPRIVNRAPKPVIVSSIIAVTFIFIPRNRDVICRGGGSKMRKIAMVAALMMVMAGSAVAQTGASSSSEGGPWPAPTGHRQPRLDQVPSDKDTSSATEAMKREDAALDRKLKSICRGC